MASNVTPETTWKAFELGNLYEDESLKYRSMDFIRCRTADSLADPSFLDISKATLVAFLNDENLNVNELGLFNAVHRWSEKHDTQDVQKVLQYIRFLTMKPEEFNGGPAMSGLLTQEQAFAILTNILSPDKCLPLPDDFSTSRVTRNLRGVGSEPDPILGRSRCIRHHEVQVPILNRGILDCAVTMTVDRNVCIYGVIVASQEFPRVDNSRPSSTPRSDLYSELLYCHLLDKDGTRLTYAHFSGDVRYGQSTMVVEFNKPVYVQKGRQYRICLVYNRSGYYNQATASSLAISQGVQFQFGISVAEPMFNEGIRDGFVRGLEFSF